MSPTTPTSNSLFENKILSAWAAVEASGAYESLDQFRDALKRIGGTDEDALRLASFEDLEEIGVPRLKAKQVASIFRARAVDSGRDETQDESIVIHRPMTDWPIDLLLQRINPTQPLSPEMIELKRRIPNEKVIAFDSKGDFNLSVTSKVVSYIQKGVGFTAEMYEGCRLYVVGEGPWRIVDACPLHTDIPLVEGRCHKCQQPWGQLSKKSRRLAYFAARRNLENASSRPQVAELFRVMEDNEKTPDSQVVTPALKLYPEAAMDYRDAEVRDELPGLTLDLGDSAASGRGGNPFGASRKF